MDKKVKIVEPITLKCPNCHANIESDDGMILYTCPDCNSKLELIHQDDGTLDVKLAINAKQLEIENWNPSGDKTKMEFFALRCPNCDAELEPEDGLVTYSCPYCKSRLLLDKQSDGTLKARLAVKQMEHEKYKLMHESEERDKEFKREQIRIREKKKEEYFPIYFLIVLIIALFAVIFFLYASDGAFIKTIKVPYDHSYFEKLNWQEAETILGSAGFDNISCIPIDKKPGIFKDAGQVMSISIDGNPKFRAKKEYSHNAPIIINYYPDA